MRAILAINLATGCVLFLWAASFNARTGGLASNLTDELRLKSPTVQPLEYGDLFELLSRATVTDAAVCAVSGGVLIAANSLGLLLSFRLPASPDPGREAGG